jgi:signal transduction histidine kinase
VTRHVQDFAHLHEIAVDVRIDGLDGESLPPLVQTTVYRVLQEALTNVARHAGARSVKVRLARGAAAVELYVQDDGGGFKSGDSGRLGLRGMRERAALLGGSVEVESHVGVGTVITGYFPVRGA